MSLENEVFDLYDKIKLVQKQINSLHGVDKELFNKYTRDLFDLKRKMQRLERDLYLHRNPDLESDDIDLYLKNIHDLKEDKPDKFNYIITKHGTKDKIGEIEVRFSLLKSEKYLGNIGAEIDDEYRGKKYSKKAFILLKDVMLEYGLIKPLFTVKEDNVPSLKSLDNIGAKRIEYVNGDEYNYYVYEYDLLEENNKNKFIK